MNLNTYVRQEARFTIDSTNADQKVQNDFQVFRPAICKCGPHVLHLRPGQLIAILDAGHTTHTSVMTVYATLNLSRRATLENDVFIHSLNLFHTLEG